MVSGYCLDSCDLKQRAHFAYALFKRSKLVWQELLQAGRHGLGYEIISKDSINRPIPSVITADTDIIAFRCIGLAPMVGFREQTIFHIVWIDKDRTLYDHGS